MKGWTNIPFRDDRVKQIRTILSRLKPHQHCDGVNECSICDQGMDEAILEELLAYVQTRQINV
jgi:hypothetical protein